MAFSLCEASYDLTAKVCVPFSHLCMSTCRQFVSHQLSNVWEMLHSLGLLVLSVAWSVHVVFCTSFLLV